MNAAGGEKGRVDELERSLRQGFYVRVGDGNDFGVPVVLYRHFPWTITRVHSAGHYLAQVATGSNAPRAFLFAVVLYSNVVNVNINLTAVNSNVHIILLARGINIRGEDSLTHRWAKIAARV